MKELILSEEHKYKRLLQFYNINQMLLANNLGISQGHLSNMLCGHKPMSEYVENEIGELLEFEQFKDKKKSTKKLH